MLVVETLFLLGFPSPLFSGYRVGYIHVHAATEDALGLKLRAVTVGIGAPLGDTRVFQDVVGDYDVRIVAVLFLILLHNWPWLG